MGIKEITFEEILPYWKKYLWSKFDIINRVNIETQKDYSYNFIKYFNQEQLVKAFKPTYVAALIDGNIVGVESGYKTNVNHYRLRGLWVNKNHRRNGIATKLLNYLENISNEKYIWTIPRESALPFYLSYGFEISGRSKEITPYGRNYFVIKKRFV